MGQHLTLASAVQSHGWSDGRTAEYYRWYPRDLIRHDGTAVRGHVDGVYIHIPFCDTICGFCPYNTIKGESDDKETYVRALLGEIDIYARTVSSTGLRFVYFGGGTPTSLRDSQVASILDRLVKRFGIAPNAEISVEAHPNHITRDRLRSLSAVGVNRVSTGLQSFDDATLRGLGCYHDAKTSREVCGLLSEEMNNSGIDILYRCRGQNQSAAAKDIETFCRDFAVPHLSLYSLYLPDANGQSSQASEVEMAVGAYEILQGFGFSHYASCASGGYDFAKPGRECRYELDHWRAPQASYLGVGVGAFGYVGESVVINRHGLSQYMRAIDRDNAPILSLVPVAADELRHRYFTLGVKTVSVSCEQYQAIFARSASDDFGSQFEILESLGLATIDEKFLNVTDIGRHFIDQISELFLSDRQRNIAHPETLDLRRFERRNLTT